MSDCPGQMTLFEQPDTIRRGPLFTGPAPSQPHSESSQAGARAIEGRPRGEIVKAILDALYEAGRCGMTVAELTEDVTRRVGRKVKETTIYGRIAGRRPELGTWVIKRGRRVGGSQVAVNVYVLRRGVPA